MALHKNKTNTIINHQEITLSQPNNQLAETLINSSIEKPLEWHITNLQANHINLNKNKVKYLLYKNRNELFPKDKDFLNDIINNTINLEENGNKNIPFCYVNNTYLEKIKNNKYKTQKFIIFN